MALRDQTMGMQKANAYQDIAVCSNQRHYERTLILQQANPRPLNPVDQ